MWDSQLVFPPSSVLIASFLQTSKELAATTNTFIHTETLLTTKRHTITPRSPAVFPNLLLALNMFIIYNKIIAVLLSASPEYFYKAY